MSLGYTPFEEGYRHGKRDFAVGLRSPDILTEASDYANGYRAELEESRLVYQEAIDSA
jgi:hypothetical protein